MNKILVLAPHTDDGELGCGGTIAKWLENGCDIHYAVFSLCEESIPQNLPKDTLAVEMKNAAKILGILPKNLHIFKYPVRMLAEHRQEILEDLIELKAQISPDIIMMPSLHDIHQDHITIANEGIRAFKTCSILGYEMVWNNLTFNSTFFVRLEKRHIEKKSEALKEYKSQQATRNYMSDEFISSLALTRGVQIGAQYAEMFEVVRWVV